MTKKDEKVYDLVFEYLDKDSPTKNETTEYKEGLKYLIDKVGDTTAMLNYGEVCREQKRYDIAMKFYEKVIECTDPEYKFDVSLAYANIGLICKDEMGDYFDPEKAYSYFVISSYLGFTGGMYEIAKCYKEGFFVKKNMDKYYDYMQTICEVADEDEVEILPEAYYELANMCYKKNEIEKARKLINKATKILKDVKERELPDKSIIDKISNLKKKIGGMKVENK